MICLFPMCSKQLFKTFLIKVYTFLKYLIAGKMDFASTFIPIHLKDHMLLLCFSFLQNSSIIPEKKHTIFQSDFQY